MQPLKAARQPGPIPADDVHGAFPAHREDDLGTAGGDQWLGVAGGFTHDDVLSAVISRVEPHEHQLITTTEDIDTVSQIARPRDTEHGCACGIGNRCGLDG